jgi:hypothetical protein
MKLPIVNDNNHQQQHECVDCRCFLCKATQIGRTMMTNAQLVIILFVFFKRKMMMMSCAFIIILFLEPHKEEKKTRQ